MDFTSYLSHNVLRLDEASVSECMQPERDDDKTAETRNSEIASHAHIHEYPVKRFEYVNKGEWKQRWTRRKQQQQQRRRTRHIIIERNAAYKDNDIKSDHFHFVFYFHRRRRRRSFFGVLFPLNMLRMLRLRCVIL